ncbi:non-canonical purine NTP pyrophosphatase [Rubrobacter calidifluminis]|uniref:non-canonical purine NTP pyrophosphatase n=1 Tax=Rubrobacter calidifluminis TaxID=1392640 RepID=UPI002362D887|nr:non-canonical purine NTP pyrophosphatase [Rubrobacter calidifluminis]
MDPIFVTSNPDKRREVEGILGRKLLSASPEVHEIQHLDLAEVARAKAVSARDALGDPPEPVIVEDSGIVFRAWNGLPGAFSRWFLEAVGVEGMLGMLSGERDRRALAVCVVAVSMRGEGIRTFRGEVRGEVADAPRGAGGFGWDPIFVPEGSSLTYAEMGEVKHEDSHRARAFREAGRWLSGGS